MERIFSKSSGLKKKKTTRKNFRVVMTSLGRTLPCYSQGEGVPATRDHTPGPIPRTHTGHVMAPSWDNPLYRIRGGGTTTVPS